MQGEDEVRPKLRRVAAAYLAKTSVIARNVGQSSCGAAGLEGPRSGVPRKTDPGCLQAANCEVHNTTITRFLSVSDLQANVEVRGQRSL